MSRADGPRLEVNTPEPLAVASVLGALVLVVLSAASTTAALPDIARSLQVTPALSVRIVSAYQLGLVMALLPSAALGERLGYRRVWKTGIAVFSAAALLCSLAPSLPWLVAARFVQGLGGAAVMALSVALLRSIVASARLGEALSWNALAVALSSAAAPSLGAWVVARAGWHSLFALQLPAAAVLMVAARFLPPVRGSGRPVDAASVSLHAGTWFALVVGCERAAEGQAEGAAWLLAAIVGMTLLVLRELPKAEPLLPLDLLRARAFRLAVLASTACFTGQTAAFVALPFYLQDMLHVDAFSTGLMITPWPLSVAVVAPIAGKLANRVSTARLCALGSLVQALGLALLSLSPRAREPLAFVLCVALCGAGFGLFQVPSNRTLLLASPRARSAAAGAMQGTARLVGQTAGALLASSMFQLTSAQAAPRWALGAGALLTLIAGFLSTLRARDGSEAAAQRSVEALTNPRCERVPRAPRGSALETRGPGSPAWSAPKAASGEGLLASRCTPGPSGRVPALLPDARPCARRSSGAP